MLISIHKLQEVQDHPEVGEAVRCLLNFLHQGQMTTLTNKKGFVYKRELIDKVFEGSRFAFLQTVAVFREYNKTFDIQYQPYHHAHRMPIHVVKMLLRHIDEGYSL